MCFQAPNGPVGIEEAKLKKSVLLALPQAGHGGEGVRLLPLLLPGLQVGQHAALRISETKKNQFEEIN
jgi:hypothetical protein